ncbi:hypothetical protein [Brevundimonas sp. NIBR11]|uniref:hypothetical protein n=1 Tax=Brevundimonas sp. NIBR11 TaxID=3015999 RepID=UPI0022F0EF39|nr:hypothetical protein [Brevundimonas sp. NIBR11]WGM32772.1 hypothetical protein KKHFBJBL_03026 [Brevundimonas sp. NIBR11]
MRATVICLATVIGLVGASAPARGQTAPPTEAREPHLQGLTAEEAAVLIGKLQDAQEKLRRGEAMYFELMSGAPASYPQTTMSPREAFLAADFSHPFQITRPRIDNPLWKPHQLILAPDGPGNLLADVEVVLGFYGDLDRVKIYYRPPHPF